MQNMADATANADTTTNTTNEYVASPNVDATIGRNSSDDDVSSDEDEDDVDVVGQAIDFEIVGLFSSTNGRSCCCHKTCGKEVVVGDLVRLVRTMVNIDGRTESAIKLVRIMDGCDGCNIGFVPRVQSRLRKVVDCLDKFAVVRELYSSSNNSYKREKSSRNRGMASASLLDYIPRNE
jgi:hypothetical protein